MTFAEQSVFSEGFHPAAKEGRQKGIGKQVTKSVRKSDIAVTKR